MDFEDEMAFTNFRTPPAVCPKCGYQMNAATPATPGTKTAPEPGDFSICIECAAALRFGPARCLREVTDEELAELALEDLQGFQLLVKAQNVVATLAGQRKKKR